MLLAALMNVRKGEIGSLISFFTLVEGKTLTFVAIA